MDGEQDFAADFERRREQQIVRARDRALGRVFDRHYAVMDRAGFDLAKHVVYRCARLQLRLAAELADGRLFAERALRPQVSDRNAVLERAARRHDFGIQARKRRRRQRAAITRLHAPQHLRFALGPVLGAAFRVADVLRERCALAEQVDDTVVERIDARAYVLQRVRHGKIPWIRG